MRRRSGVLLLAAALAASGGAQAAQANIVDSPARERTEGRQRQARVQMDVPLVKQAYRNNCETASLSMLLAAAGVTVDQRQLQRELVKSGAADPSVAADGSWTWGDPALGFVGRVMGGGTAGGFGVYEDPIRKLASSYGVNLADLSRQPIELVLSLVATRWGRYEAGAAILALTSDLGAFRWSPGQLPDAPIIVLPSKEKVTFFERSTKRPPLARRYGLLMPSSPLLFPDGTSGRSTWSKLGRQRMGLPGGEPDAPGRIGVAENVQIFHMSQKRLVKPRLGNAATGEHYRIEASDLPCHSRIHIARVQ